MTMHRIGTPPQDRGCHSTQTCPDIFENEDGMIVVIGRDVTDELRGKLPADAGCGPDERIVLIPRRVFRDAAQEMCGDPDRLALGCRVPRFTPYDRNE